MENIQSIEDRFEKFEGVIISISTYSNDESVEHDNANNELVYKIPKHVIFDPNKGVVSDMLFHDIKNYLDVLVEGLNNV